MGYKTEFGHIKLEIIGRRISHLIYLTFLECRNGSINYCVEYDCSSETDIRCSQCQPTHPITGLPLIPNKANKKCKSKIIILLIQLCMHV